MAIGTNGIAIHWYGLDAADAPTLLLLHGRRDSGRCWPDAVRRWGSSFRIAAPDARGHGRSPRFTAEQLAAHPIRVMYEDTVEILARISDDGARPVILVGHSMGGGVGAAVAARHPELLRAAVLEDPAWHRAVDRKARRDSAARAVREAAAFRQDMAGQLALARAERPQWPEVELAPWAQAKADCDDAFMASGHGFLLEPWLDFAKSIAVPTLLVTGTDGVILDEPNRRRIEALGNSRLRLAVIDGAGHSVRRGRTTEFHRLVDPWLSAQIPAR